MRDASNIGIELAQKIHKRQFAIPITMAVESRGDLASRHGSIGRIAVAHSSSYRSDNPICTSPPPRPRIVNDHVEMNFFEHAPV